MAFTAITTTEIQVGKPGKQTLWQKVKDCLDYLYGQLGVLNAPEGIQNASFEVDSDSDGIPDGWTKGLYSGGTGAYETTNPLHGAASFKFTHPGGAGNGGGYLLSDYLPAGQIALAPSFLYKCSAAGIKVMCQMLWYDKAKTLMGTTTPFTSVANPTQWALVNIANLLEYPGDARYVKIKLIGGYNDTDVAGDVWFDQVSLSNAAAGRVNLSETINQGEVSGSPSGWTDCGSTYNITIPAWAKWLTLRIQTKVGETGSGQVRFRIGANYSTSGSTTTNPVSTTYAPKLCVLDVSTLSGAQTIVFQWDQTSALVYLKCETDDAKFYQIRTRTADDALGTITDA